MHFDMVLAGSWVGIVGASSLEEMKWFIGQYVSVGMFACVTAIVACIVCLERVLRCIRTASVSWITLVASAIVVVSSFAINHRLGVSHRMMAQFFPAVYLIPDSIICFSEQRSSGRMARFPQIPSSVRMQSDEAHPVLGVFVLGESASRNHWSLYGYDRATTPNVDALRNELVVFGDMVTTDGNTSAAMRGLFSTRTAEHHSDFRYSMSQILKRCGFSVVLYSNHRRWDQYYSDETFSFAGCDPFLCMSEQGETNHYDGVLLKYLDRSLECATCNRVVFLHLMGSHFELADRYPPGDAPFGTRTEKGIEHTQVDHYDNTIWYTDKILGEVVRKLKALHKPAWMIYVSDHGETPSAKGWRTATDNDLWEIPFVVWTSPEFNAAYPERVAALRRAKDKPLQSDQLLYGLLRFMGVEGLGNAPEEDFLSDAFKPRTPRLILSGTTAYQPTAR
jgi:heptose-I-phosphate ethanolaminephosphotransferase